MRASHLPPVRDQPATASTRASRPPPAPLVLGRYRLISRLGAGAFGTVWRARDERLEREVAVKIVPRERIVGGRFEREARAAARLAHPGIVTLYEAAIDDEGAYLVSELVLGSTLGRLLEGGRLSDRDIVEIGIALCDALAHAHALDVIHRDLKPSNILVPNHPAAPSQVAKLTDFGVARVIGGDSLTRTGDVVGTAAYMAPEQAEGLEAGAAADLYALALVIYEALTGINPIRTSTAAQRARRLGAHLPPLRRQRRDLPLGLGQAIDLALRPRPSERGTIDELRNGLRDVLEVVEDTPGVVEPAWPLRATEQQPAEPRPIQPPGPRGPPRLPHRALAGAAAGATTFWLATHVISPRPIAPAAAALTAALCTALLPRLGWLALQAAVATALMVQHRPGAALVLAIAAIVPVFSMPRSGTSWPLPALAPALGLIGIAGMWPALAAGAATAWRRAALAASGWIWLVLAAPLAGRDLYARRPSGTPDPSTWIASPYQATHHVLAPVLTSGVLLPAAVWAIAAVLLRPLLRHGPAPTLIWAVAVALATGAALYELRLLSVPMALLGTLASVLVALAPAVTSRLSRVRNAANVRAGLP